MASYIRIPLDFVQKGSKSAPYREQKSKEEMLGNLLEMIVFTPRGSFGADPDFGFEYWNNEYSNTDYEAFNTNQDTRPDANDQQQLNRQDCIESIKKSMETYAPFFKVDDVRLIIEGADIDKQEYSGNGQGKKQVYSRCRVELEVRGYISEEDKETFWSKNVSFLVEPTAKKSY